MKTNMGREHGNGTTGTQWIDRLQAKGYISDPKSKAKSLVVTVKGVKRPRKLFEKHFEKKKPEARQR